MINVLGALVVAAKVSQPRSCADGDASNFQDAFGIGCSGWVLFDCNNDIYGEGYNEAQLKEVLHACPVACGLCEDYAFKGELGLADRAIDGEVALDGRGNTAKPGSKSLLVLSSAIVSSTTTTAEPTTTTAEPASLLSTMNFTTTKTSTSETAAVTTTIKTTTTPTFEVATTTFDASVVFTTASSNTSTTSSTPTSKTIIAATTASSAASSITSTTSITSSTFTTNMTSSTRTTSTSTTVNATSTTTAAIIMTTTSRTTTKAPLSSITATSTSFTNTTIATAKVEAATTLASPLPTKTKITSTTFITSTRTSTSTTSSTSTATATTITISRNIPNISTSMKRPTTSSTALTGPIKITPSSSSLLTHNFDKRTTMTSELLMPTSDTLSTTTSSTTTSSTASPFTPATAVSAATTIATAATAATAALTTNTGGKIMTASKVSTPVWLIQEPDTIPLSADGSYVNRAMFSGDFVFSSCASMCDSDPGNLALLIGATGSCWCYTSSDLTLLMYSGAITFDGAREISSFTLIRNVGQAYLRTFQDDTSGSVSTTTATPISSTSNSLSSFTATATTATVTTTTTVSPSITTTPVAAPTTINFTPPGPTCHGIRDPGNCTLLIARCGTLFRGEEVNKTCPATCGICPTTPTTTETTTTTQTTSTSVTTSETTTTTATTSSTPTTSTTITTSSSATTTITSTVSTTATTSTTVTTTSIDTTTTTATTDPLCREKCANGGYGQCRTADEIGNVLCFDVNILTSDCDHGLKSLLTDCGVPTELGDCFQTESCRCKPGALPYTVFLGLHDSCECRCIAAPWWLTENFAMSSTTRRILPISTTIPTDECTVKNCGSMRCKPGASLTARIELDGSCQCSCEPTAVCIDKTEDFLPWIDTDGALCEWYDLDPEFCTEYGHSTSITGLSATQACCTCGGGQMVFGEVTSTSLPATQSVSTSISTSTSTQAPSTTISPTQVSDISTTARVTCGVGHFMCADRSKCIKLKEVCDGLSDPDCPDGSDETNCTTTSAAARFTLTTTIVTTSTKTSTISVIATTKSTTSPTTSMTISSSTTTHYCEAVTCARRCRDECGWSTIRKKCVLGEITEPNEIDLGFGCPVTSTTSTVTTTTTITTTALKTTTSMSDTTTTTEEPNTLTITPTDIRSTSSTTVTSATISPTMSVISTDTLLIISSSTRTSTSAENDPCNMITCARICNDECGWSEGRCVTGKVTAIADHDLGFGCSVTASIDSSTIDSLSQSVTSTSSVSSSGIRLPTQASTVEFSDNNLKLIVVVLGCVLLFALLLVIIYCCRRTESLGKAAIYYTEEVNEAGPVNSSRQLRDAAFFPTAHYADWGQESLASSSDNGTIMSSSDFTESSWSNEDTWPMQRTAINLAYGQSVI